MNERTCINRSHRNCGLPDHIRIQKAYTFTDGECVYNKDYEAPPRYKRRENLLCGNVLTIHLFFESVSLIVVIRNWAALVCLPLLPLASCLWCVILAPAVATYHSILLLLSESPTQFWALSPFPACSWFLICLCSKSWCDCRLQASKECDSFSTERVDPFSYLKAQKSIILMWYLIVKKLSKTKTWIKGCKFGSFHASLFLAFLCNPCSVCQPLF